MPEFHYWFGPDHLLLPELTHLGWTRAQRVRSAGLGPHQHQAWEFHLVVRGHVDWWVEDVRLQVPAHQVTLTRPRQRHGATHALLEPGEMCWFGLRLEPGDCLPGVDAPTSALILARLQHMPVSLPMPQADALAGWWRDLVGLHLQGPDPLRTLAARGLLHRILGEILGVAAGSRMVRIERSPAIARVLEYALGQLHRNVRVAELAKVAGWSPSRFHERFQREVGTTPADWLRDVRLEHAKRQLGDGDRSITDIALATGFSSSQHFATVFRQQVGMTPRAFRQVAKEQRMSRPETSI